jgi:AraC-like DNA-binding protein
LPYFKIYPSPLQLNSLIKEIQVYHINWREEKNLPDPYITCLANTEQNLYFFVRDTIKVVPVEKVEIPVPPVIATGPKYKPSGLIYGEDHLMIKVAFHPTGTYRLLGINMQQTVNTGLDATAFWGKEVLKILSLLRQSFSYDLMVETVCSFLDSKFDARCRPLEAIDDTVIQMMDPLKIHTLKEWASLACLSQRQFERNFITRVGISPKLFIRIVRFEFAMKIKNGSRDKSWLDIAFESGYTDSSHLLKEFREFAEFPPSSFYHKPTSGYSEFPTG